MSRATPLRAFYDGNPNFNSTVSLTNIDDIFRHLAKHKVESVSVTPEEMIMVVSFLAACSGRPLDDLEKFNADVLELLKSGTVDRCFGVRLETI